MSQNYNEIHTTLEQFKKQKPQVQLNFSFPLRNTISATLRVTWRIAYYVLFLTLQPNKWNAIFPLTTCKTHETDVVFLIDIPVQCLMKHKLF